MTRMSLIAGHGILMLASLFAAAPSTALADDLIASELSAGNVNTWGIPDGWILSKAFTDFRGYAKRPEKGAHDNLTVDWRNPEFDALGRCIIRGRLVLAVATKDEARPVGWFQGVAVYMARAPNAKPDWTKGMNRADSLQGAAVVNQSGEFALRFDLRETQHDLNSEERFQFAAALATHVPKAGAGEEVIWNSQTPPIPGTIRMLSVPPATRTPRELELIHRASGWPFSNRITNPSGVDLIRAVNALQKLGKEQALVTLEKYIEMTKFGRFYGQDVVFWIIRLLFEPVQAGSRIPPPLIAVILDDTNFADDMKWPLNPIEVVDDIPFMVGQQVALGGSPEHPRSHIVWARRHGVVRATPLVPTANPLQAAEAILSSRRFKALDEFSRETASLRMHAVAMVKDLLPPVNTEESGEIVDEEWKACLEKAKRLGIHWDAQREQFVIK